MNYFDWNDNELVNYWELAKNEYMKYYSISRDKKRTLATNSISNIEPSIDPSTSTITGSTMKPSIDPSSMNSNNAKISKTSLTVNTSLDQTVKTHYKSQENNETMHFLFPGKQINDSTKEIIMNQMNEYYTGYKHGLHSTTALNNLPTSSALFQLGFNNSRLFF